LPVPHSNPHRAPGTRSLFPIWTTRCFGNLRPRRRD
jgi:hypothetical protein